MPDTDPDTDGYWVVNHRNLAGMLRRVAGGENPDLVLLDEFANADHELLHRLQPAPTMHRITSPRATTDIVRNQKTIHLECSVPGCFTGSVRAIPIAAADAVADLIQAHHNGPDPTS